MLYNSNPFILSLGYNYSADSGMYYLQSRYYDPAIGRFINADSYTSTGQGVLGNNMFAYCLNNPIILADTSGAASKVCLTGDDTIGDVPWRNLSPGGGGKSRHAVASEREYIKNQSAQGIGNLKLGWATVDHGGCGVIATYNALITLGDAKDFSDVLSYFQGKTCLFGYLGILPHTVADYFTSKGYTVVVTDNRDAIDVYSQTADACILWYTWPETYGGIDAFGAHFVHYRKNDGGYIAYNTGYNGVRTFSVPSSFAYLNDRNYAIGIFIFK